MTAHTELIRDQFTRQAIPFATAPAMSDARVLQALTEFAQVSAGDTVLDVACGPGLVAAAFAKTAKEVAGIDLTPAMIKRATAHCLNQGLGNVHFKVGNVETLPFTDSAFSLVVSRFAFHHFETPQIVLNEMVRCCKPGGRILLVDATGSDDPAKAAAFNRVEKLRDPSHVEFRPSWQLTTWVSQAGLKLLGTMTYSVKVELEALLSRSFPAEGDADRIRTAFAEALDDDVFGVDVHSVGSELRFAYPAVALLAERTR